MIEKMILSDKVHCPLCRKIMSIKPLRDNRQRDRHISKRDINGYALSEPCSHFVKALWNQFKVYLAQFTEHAPGIIIPEGGMNQED